VVSGSSSVAATLAGTVRSAAQAGSTGGVRGGCRSIPEPDPVNVVARPAAVGDMIGTLTIVDNTAGGPQVVDLYGWGE
jgi:hypothetical protein